MDDNVKLYWHPGFGAVLCIDADSGQDISSVLNDCTFTQELTSSDVRFVRRRYFLRIRKLLRRLFS